MYASSTVGDRRSSQAGLAPIGYVLLLLIVAALTIAMLAFLDAITRRREEARSLVFRVVELDEETVDPAEWGKNFPQQYDAYLRTVDTARTRHGGSQAFQKLDADPIWRVLFSGYAFGIDYREERGHAYMLQDQRETERVTREKQPGACLHCHASVVAAYRKVGVDAGAPGALDAPFQSPEARAQLQRGFEAVCAMPYEKATALVEHPVACLDCHDPSTMRLRVTRPAFLEGIDVLARGDTLLPHLPSVGRWRLSERDRAYDPNELASRQEMRTLVCAQCHVEYYIRGTENRLVYPWSAGLRAEEIESVYDDLGFRDWVHADSLAPMLKAQHPEFELWSQGLHARSGVACADCHMPYVRVGAIKVSDHHVRSPLLQVHRACQPCHGYPEDELVSRATAIQDKTQELMLRAEEAALALVQTLRAAHEGGLGDDALAAARQLHRQAQWRLDFVAAENSMGFHAAQEAARLLGEAIDYARQGEVAVLEARAAAEPR